ncbi:MAG: hypothetical protein JWN07_3193 [Hyphomicrobiales bacterium]|nr:hypothetical protein [Hyphomicrobiales bacterium]
MELLGQFDRQAGLAGPRLRASVDPEAAMTLARMLGSTARIAGAFAVAAACDGYVAAFAGGLPERQRMRALEILEEEIGIARSAISELLSPQAA